MGSPPHGLPCPVSRAQGRPLAFLVTTPEPPRIWRPSPPLQGLVSPLQLGQGTQHRKWAGETPQTKDTQPLTLSEDQDRHWGTAWAMTTGPQGELPPTGSATVLWPRELPSGALGPAWSSGRGTGGEEELAVGGPQPLTPVATPPPGAHPGVLVEVLQQRHKMGKALQASWSGHNVENTQSQGREHSRKFQTHDDSQYRGGPQQSPQPHPARTADTLGPSRPQEGTGTQPSMWVPGSLRCPLWLLHTHPGSQQ